MLVLVVEEKFIEIGFVCALSGGFGKGGISVGSGW